MKKLTLIAALVICTCFAFPAKGLESYESVPPEIQRRMEESRLNLMEWLHRVDKDVFLPGKFIAKDKLFLMDYSTAEGKVLDYGPYLVAIDESRRRIIPRADVEKLELSWGSELPQKPDTPDLDVTYIERLPRYRTNHGNNQFFPWRTIILKEPNNEPVWPPAGTKTTFKAHVVNKGPVASKPFKYEWRIDGRSVNRGTHMALDPAQEVILDYLWIAKDGSHTVTFRVMPDGDDFSAWNNSRTDRTDSLGLMFICAKSTYDGFNDNLNMVESFSFEDWLQRHLDGMNFLFRASVYPGCPEGCLERVRMDQFVVADDDKFGEAVQTAGLRPDGSAENEGRWSFSPWSNYDVLARGVDWGLIHELGHQLGLVDYYTLDFGRHGIFSRDKNGDIIDVGTSYPYEGMMRGHGPVAFTEVSAVSLNLERGKHRGGYGDHLFNIPKECGIRILDGTGEPIPDAELRIFRRASGVCSGVRRLIVMSEGPVFEGKTDEDGVFMLPNETPPFTFTTYNGFTLGPGPFGDALVLCDTGLLLIEVWKDGRRDIQFTDVTEFVKGKGRGFADKYIDDIETILPGGEGSLLPPQIVRVEPEGSCDLVRIQWNNMDRRAVKFRIYRYRDGLPFINLWKSEVATVDVEGVFSMVIRVGGWITMTAVDRVGNESAPSEPVYVPRRYFSKIAVNNKNEVLSADWGILKIRPDGKITSLPVRAVYGIDPAYWVSNAVAVLPNDNLAVLNAGVCKVGVFGPDFDYAKFGPKEKDANEDASYAPEIERRAYEAYKGKFPTQPGEGQYIQFFFGDKGNGDGQFENPSDLDLGGDGKFYVADTGNNRIAIFSPEGEFIANVGEGKIEKPVQVEVDPSGNIYVIQQGKTGLLQIPRNGDGYGDPVELVKTTVQPSDVTSDVNGRIFLAQRAEPGLRALDSGGNTLGTLDDWNGTSMREITGMEVDRTGNVACGIGQRGELLSLPISEVVKQQ
jgi:hypothetical protein